MPEVTEEVWQAYESVFAQRHTQQLAVVLRLSEDERAFEVRACRARGGLRRAA